MGRSVTGSPRRRTSWVPGIDFDVAKADRVGELALHATGGGAAQQRVDAREQLEQAERLGDVVVGAKVKAEHFVGLLAARAENQDRRVDALLAQRAQDAISIHSREHQVEHDEIGRDRTREREPAGSVARQREPRSLRSRGCCAIRSRGCDCPR